MASCIIPIFAWTILAQRGGIPYALLVGCLLMGFSAARFSGDVMRDRLVGLEYKGIYTDVIVIDAILLVCLLTPGLPPWASSASVAVALVWTFIALAGQFGRTVARVREVLGVGLFGPVRDVEIERGDA
jgi:hypothetical protein